MWVSVAGSCLGCGGEAKSQSMEFARIEALIGTVEIVRVVGRKG